MSLDIISIIILLLVIVIGFLKKVNVGILSIFAAAVFGFLTDVPSKEIIGGFGVNLFITLLGITFLTGTAQNNGSIQKFASKSIKVVGDKTWLTPLAIWILGIVISGIGPGSIPTLGVMCAIAIPLAQATGYDPVMMAIIGEVGIFAGRFSPVTSDSAVIRGLAEVQGFTNYQSILFTYALITSAIIALLVFLYFGGHKVKPSKSIIDGENEEPYTESQKFTLIGFLITIILTVVLKWNIGLAAFSVMSVLIILGYVDEKKAISSIPWGVLILVSGVGILMNLVIKFGGIDLISTSLGSIMTERTAPAIVGAISGIMSWFSSATGVVYPTMIPTVNGLVEQVGGNVSPDTLISMIAICAAYAGLSPASTGGGLILATIATDPDFTKELENKIFVKLFVVSALSLLIIIILALLGLYSIL